MLAASCSRPTKAGVGKQNAVGGWRRCVLFQLGRRRLSGYYHCVNVRVLLLALFFSFLLTQGTCRADGASNSSRKASEIMPILNQIAQTDPPREVFERVKKILGSEPDAGESGGPIGRFWTAEWYFLDDKTRGRYRLFEREIQRGIYPACPANSGGSFTRLLKLRIKRRNVVLLTAHTPPNLAPRRRRAWRRHDGRPSSYGRGAAMA